MAGGAKWIVAGLLYLLFQWGLAAGPTSVVIQAQIEQVTPRGYILKTLTSRLTVEDTPETRCWIGKAEAPRGKFLVGDTVFARVKTTTEPGVLREIADPISWAWLESIRKEVRQGRVVDIGPSTLRVVFADASTMSYRVTAKSKLMLLGKPVSLLDLKPGQGLFLKGRTLPGLDLWLVWGSDRPETPPKEPGPSPIVPGPQPVPKPTPKRTPVPVTPPRAKPIKLVDQGTFVGQVLAHFTKSRMFDVGPYLVHVSYSTSTVFTRGGLRVRSSALKPGQTVQVVYRRSKYGRVTAQAVAILGGPL